MTDTNFLDFWGGPNSERATQNLWSGNWFEAEQLQQSPVTLSGWLWLVTPTVHPVRRSSRKTWNK